MNDRNGKTERAPMRLLEAGVLAGLALFVFGLYLWWPPLAPLVGGLLLATGCALAGYDRFRQGGR